MNGDEEDAFSKYARRVVGFKRTSLRKIKKTWNRRVRHTWWARYKKEGGDEF